MMNHDEHWIFLLGQVKNTLHSMAWAPWPLCVPREFSAAFFEGAYSGKELDFSCDAKHFFGSQRLLWAPTTSWGPKSRRVVKYNLTLPGIVRP